jgi:hypothetical protein
MLTRRSSCNAFVTLRPPPRRAALGLNAQLERIVANLALIRDPVALVRDPVALIRDPVALTRDSVALTRDPPAVCALQVAVSHDPLAVSHDPLTLCDEALALGDETLTLTHRSDEQFKRRGRFTRRRVPRLTAIFGTVGRAAPHQPARPTTSRMRQG